MNVAENRKMMERPDAFEEIVTDNKEMLSLFQYTESIATSSEPILITGETGVGKELMVKALYRLSGLRGRFVAINLAGLDDTVFSDTLFGHVRGAFTGAERDRQGLIEQAAGGLLFLDEIGDIGHPSQVKLLRLIEEREYLPMGRDEPKKTDARIVSVTNADLWALQRTGKFRKDLNFRIRTHHIHIPPLRERLDDLPILLEYFAARAAASLNKEKPSYTEELIALLGSYPFPGNVRELKSMIFDAVSRQTTEMFQPEVFRSYLDRTATTGTIQSETEPRQTDTIQFPEKLPTIKEAARLLVAEAMKRANNNRKKAAELLGISRQALSKRLKG
jgi:transcriptional regulator with PAS, ATPase and Fis domain